MLSNESTNKQGEFDGCDHDTLPTCHKHESKL